jgi:hypothetical protein
VCESIQGLCSNSQSDSLTIGESETRSRLTGQPLSIWTSLFRFEIVKTATRGSWFSRPKNSRLLPSIGIDRIGIGTTRPVYTFVLLCQSFSEVKSLFTAPVAFQKASSHHGGLMNQCIQISSRFLATSRTHFILKRDEIASRRRCVYPYQLRRKKMHHGFGYVHVEPAERATFLRCSREHSKCPGMVYSESRWTKNEICCEYLKQIHDQISPHIET